MGVNCFSTVCIQKVAFLAKLITKPQHGYITMLLWHCYFILYLPSRTVIFNLTELQKDPLDEYRYKIAVTSDSLVCAVIVIFIGTISLLQTTAAQGM